MPPYVATALCAIFVMGLFWLGREQKAGTSPALWIPVIWLLLAASRSASQWLGMAPLMISNEILLEGNPLDRIVYASLLAAGMIVLATRRAAVGKLVRANGLVLIFFLYCGASLLWSDFPDVAFKRWFKSIGDLVMVLVVWTEIDPTVAVHRFLVRATYVLMPLSVLLIKYYPALGRTYGRWLGEVHYTGVTTNKNSMGAICFLFGLATLWRLLVALRRNRKHPGRQRVLIADVVILAIILWLLWMSDSMTSLVCFVMGCGLVLALNLTSIRRKPLTLHLIIAGMLMACVAVLFLGVSPSVLTAMGKSSTLTDRTEIWPLLVSLCKNSFVGTGFGSFWLGPRLENIWSVYEWRPNQAHNGYLEIYLNVGWIGVALLAVVLVTGYRNVFRACRRNTPLGSLLLVYFVVGVAYNLTEAAFFQMLAPVWIVFLLATVGHSFGVRTPSTVKNRGNRASHGRSALTSSSEPNHEEAPSYMEEMV
jgi:exopolysaccharide production protein ExoQ